MVPAASAGTTRSFPTRIGPQVVIDGVTTIGEENVILGQASLGAAPQDLSYRDEPTCLEIGDRNHFREFCTVHRGTEKGGGKTVIGDDNLFMTYTHIAHDCIVGNRTIFANNGTLAGHVEVDDDATIGAFSSVHQFCKVGRHAYIGGYSVLTRNVLPFVKTVGIKPSCYGINRIGLERKGFSAEILTTLEKAYRILVRSKLNTSQALGRLRDELGEVDEVAYLIDFVESSERGVIKDLPSRRGSRGGG